MIENLPANQERTIPVKLLRGLGYCATLAGIGLFVSGVAEGNVRSMIGGVAGTVTGINVARGSCDGAVNWL